MALTESTMVSLGKNAPDFYLEGTDYKMYSLKDFENKPLVVIFTCNHCPYAQAIESRLIHLASDYQDSVFFVAINSNDVVNYPEDSMENMRKRAKDNHYPFPYLLDKTQDIARNYGAVCTPDIFLFNSEQHLEYRGRLDDNWQNENEVTSEDLKSAIDSVLASKIVNPTQHPSMGCNIKWK
tara:strand:+ start:16258 stop:16800 length:543 start_codon:yes stop_codon:yes gene_type:complete